VGGYVDKLHVSIDALLPQRKTREIGVEVDTLAPVEQNALHPTHSLPFPSGCLHLLGLRRRSTPTMQTQDPSEVHSSSPVL
jgi:hypothetical protein